jgi:hypothetical protein
MIALAQFPLHNHCYHPHTPSHHLNQYCVHHTYAVTTAYLHLCYSLHNHHHTITSKYLYLHNHSHALCLHNYPCTITDLPTIASLNCHSIVTITSPPPLTPPPLNYHCSIIAFIHSPSNHHQPTLT